MTPRPLPQSLHIGPVSVSPPTVLAPMEALTDAPFRALVRGMGGCGLAVTELVSARELTLRTRRAMTLASIATDARPVAIQIYGRDPEILAESARLCEDQGPDIIDINMGCPSRAVTRHASGAALMRDPERARAIVRAVRRATSLPLTVKLRLGWDRDSINAPALARMCEEEGADAVTVHGRTRADMFKGRADWEGIARVKAAVDIPVVGNGDVFTAADALRLFKTASVDGIMMGRGVIRNPWLIVQVSQALAGEPVMQPSIQQKRRYLLSYYALIESQHDRPRSTLGKMKKVIGYFTEGVPNALDLRQNVFHSSSIDEAVTAVQRFFDQAEKQAARDREDCGAA